MDIPVESSAGLPQPSPSPSGRPEPAPDVCLAELPRDGVLPLATALGYATDVATALRELHAEGRAHGEAGPDDVRVGPRGAVLPPPPASSRRGDQRADMVAFGALLFELVTGSKPPRDLSSVAVPLAPRVGSEGLRAAAIRLALRCLGAASDPAPHMQQALMEVRLYSLMARQSDWRVAVAATPPPSGEGPSPEVVEAEAPSVERLAAVAPLGAEQMLAEAQPPLAGEPLPAVVEAEAQSADLLAAVAPLGAEQTLAEARPPLAGEPLPAVVEAEAPSADLPSAVVPPGAEQMRAEARPLPAGEPLPAVVETEASSVELPAAVVPPGAAQMRAEARPLPAGEPLPAVVEAEAPSADLPSAAVPLGAEQTPAEARPPLGIGHSPGLADFLVPPDRVPRPMPPSTVKCPHCGGLFVYRSRSRTAFEHLLDRTGMRLYRCHRCSYRYISVLGMPCTKRGRFA